MSKVCENCDDFVQCVPTKKGHQILFKGYTYVFKNNEQIPEWTLLYFDKLSATEMKCQLCQVILPVHDKSMELLEHFKADHRDIHDLHRDNPETTAGFRIEFVNLNNMLKAGDSKTQPIILGEATTEPTDINHAIIQKDNEIILDKDTILIHKDAEIVIKDSDMQYVLYDNTKRKQGTGLRKRSWVWKYFDKLSNIIYRCRLCNVVLSIKGCNSNNMNRHIRTRHPIVFETEASKQNKVRYYVTSEESAPIAIKTEEISSNEKDDVDIPGESPSQRLRRSWIWSYFTRVSQTQAQCMLCKRYICHGGNATGNMNRHLKMIHKKTAFSYDQSWVWKVFDSSEEGIYSCKICQFKCTKLDNIEKDMKAILSHLKTEHGVVSGDQIITGNDVGDDITE